MDNEDEENDDQVGTHSLQPPTCTKVAGFLNSGLVALCMQFFGSCTVCVGHAMSRVANE